MDLRFVYCQDSSQSSPVHCRPISQKQYCSFRKQDCIYVFVSGKNITCHVCYYCLISESIIILQPTKRAGARHKIHSWRSNNNYYLAQNHWLVKIIAVAKLYQSCRERISILHWHGFVYEAHRPHRQIRGWSRSPRNITTCQDVATWSFLNGFVCEPHRLLIDLIDFS